MSGPGKLPGYPAVVPLPNHPRISPWEAALWRAFGHWDYFDELGRRSFDQGTVRLPDESDEEHAVRVDRHARLDAAERELIEALVTGRVIAKGRRPAKNARGIKLHLPSNDGAEPIPANYFLRSDLAFGADETIYVRAPLLERLFPSLGLRGSDDDPGPPMWHEVTIDTAELRALWPGAKADIAELTAWMNNEGEGIFIKTGKRPKADGLKSGCIEKFSCHARDAALAVKNIHPHLRRGRGDRN